MIIRQLILLNFGIYKNEHILNLTPEPCNGFNRPIVLIRGNNGTGKTTLVEAIRLCLQGSFVLGSRVSRLAYEEYLAKRIHVPVDIADRPTVTKVGLILEYVSEGQKKIYEIERAWEVVDGKVKEDIDIRENDEVLTDLHTREEKDTFLRDLVPPGVIDLFFFDGEKLRILAESDTNTEFLADTIKALLGLNLVEQLQKDLDVYLSRQETNNDQNILQFQLEEVLNAITLLESNLENLRIDQLSNVEAIANKRSAIAEQEQRLAGSGNVFAERLENLKLAQQRLKLEIEAQYRKAQETANGLLPFAIAPQMCQRIVNRLLLEAEYERTVASNQIVLDHFKQVSFILESPEFWQDISVNEFDKRKIIAKFKSIWDKTIEPLDIKKSEIILQVSEKDRQALLEWIERSGTQTSSEFRQCIERLNFLEEELHQVEQELQLVPAEEILKPLIETLNDYNRELGSLQRLDENLVEQVRSLEYKLKQQEHQRERLRQQIVEQKQGNHRVQLLHRTQVVLREYAEELNREKIVLLERRLVRRFNGLSRKEDLIDSVNVDPKTFKIILYRKQQSFEIGQLSAGERQVLAMAIMWALQEISGVPLLVIFDTPLGRLDNQHRFNLIHKFFPQVSHQVLLLVTDTEIDDESMSDLTPVISRIYYLTYETDRGCAVVYEGNFMDTTCTEKVIV